MYIHSKADNNSQIMPLFFQSCLAGHGVPGPHPPHERGYPSRIASKQEVGMIGQKCPCIASRFGFRREDRDPVKKVFAVLITLENRTALDTAYHNVMKNPGGV